MFVIYFFRICYFRYYSVFKIHGGLKLRVTQRFLAYTFVKAFERFLPLACSLGGLKWTRTTDLTLIRRAL